MFRAVILTDFLQVMLSLIGLVLSLNQLHMAWLAKVDALADPKSDPSTILVANIRLRRERARTWKHLVFLLTGAAITWWRVTSSQPDMISWVSITRDLSILIVSWILIRETILAMSDRREVGAMMDSENKKKTNGDTLIVQKQTNGSLNITSETKEVADGSQP